MTPRVDPPLSVVILTFNEEKNLPVCLRSLDGLKAEIFVVDSGSTDRTLEIARAAKVVLAEHPFIDYGSQRNWAQQNLPIRTEWVLHLDADERLTPELVTEINQTMANPDPQVDGYLLRKRTFFMGRWMRHGGHYPAFHLRLFRKSKGSCENRKYDQHYLVDGRVSQLQNDYIDVVCSDLTTWSMRHVRWAGAEAAEIAEDVVGGHQIEAKLGGTAIEQKRWLRSRFYQRWPPFWRAFLYWFLRYFVRMGFLDGKEGMIFHFLQGYWFRFLVDSILYERSLESRTVR